MAAITVLIHFEAQENKVCHGFHASSSICQEVMGPDAMIIVFCILNYKPPFSLLQHPSSKASILRCSVFFIVQLSHPYMTTGKTIALTRQTFVGKVMSLLLNMLSRLVITFLPRSKQLLISWLQSPSAVILEPKKVSLPLFPLFPHLFAMKG